MYQTRSEEKGTREWNTFKEAMNYARTYQDVWKVSWTTSDGARIRLIYAEDDNVWIYSPMIEEE